MDPSERLPDPPVIYETLKGLPTTVALPAGVDRNASDWYAQKYTTRDGRTFYEFYKRGGKPANPDGTYPPDEVRHTVQGATNTEQADRFKKEQEAATKPAPTVSVGGVPNVVVGKDPTTGQDIYGPVQTTTGPANTAAAAQTPANQNEAILNQQRAKNAALPGPNPQGATEEERRGQDPRYETDEARAQRADATIKAQGAEAKAAAEANKPTIAPGAGGRPAVQYVPDPDHPGQVKAVPIPGAPEAPAEQISAPSDQMWIARQRPGQPPEFVKNPNYVKPSRIMPDPGDPTKLINVTHDDNGNVISVPVTGTTVIKPADLPVLQAKYGTIASSLGALAQDLNSRYARGEITEKQKNDAFTAAHQQASTQVAEINSILENSRAVWAGQVQQRGQSLQETQSRRSYASGVLGNALDTSNAIAKGAVGPGAGRDIVGGMAAILGIGKQYAEGMGGFKESPEIPLPAALQQAQGIGLPGYGPPGVPPVPGVPGGPPTAPGGSPAPLLRPPPPVTGSVTPPPPVPLPGMAPIPGAPPPVPLPAGPMPSAGQPGYGDPGFFRPAMQGAPTGDPGFYPPGMQGPSTTDPGFSRPGIPGMGAQLQGASGYGGSPVAAGGAGLYDPSADVQAMIGDGSDPTWAEAVRRAAATVTQPGYAWSRFTQPASRFG